VVFLFCWFCCVVCVCFFLGLVFQFHALTFGWLQHTSSLESQPTPSKHRRQRRCNLSIVQE
jgi:hypothetical protein